MNRLIFYLKETFKSIFRNKNTTIATVISMSTALIILGIILSVVLNINNFVIMSKQEFSGMQVFIKNEVNQEKLLEIKESLEKNPKLRDVTFVSKEETMQSFLSNMGSEADLFNDIDNPCENSFIVYIKNPQEYDTIEKSLRANENVSSISYYKDTIDTLLKISRAISIVSIIIIGILFFLSLLIIENMIKIAIFSRMREISIMKNIGATNWFIRWPFILEGALLGAVGSILSMVLINFVYSSIYNSFSKTAIFAKYLVDDAIMSNLVVSLFIPTGIGIGIIGSIVSLRKYLKV